MEKEQMREKVAIVKYDGTSNALKKAIELCGGFEELKADDKILLKPNILWGGTKKLPPYGVVTTLTMVDHLLQLLRERGCKDITVGEGTIVNKELGSSTFRGYDWSGIGKVAKRYGVKLVDFNSDAFEEVDLEEIKINISRRALESDFLINLPVLKTHRQTRVSLGMKNLKGCLAQSSKKKFHKQDLARLIALLNTKIKTSLTIIDGIYAIEGGPEFLGTSHRTNLIISGKDIFSCDLVGTVVMGMKPEEVEYLKSFAAIQGRSLSLDAIEMKGEAIEEVAQKLDWRLSYEGIFRQAQISGIIVQEPGLSCCSGCGAILSAFAAIFSKDNPGVVLDRVKICVGGEVQAKEESKKVFLLGNCAIAANRDLKEGIEIKGCPPPMFDTVGTLVRKSLPSKMAAKILMSRLIKNIGIKLRIYDETFPAFGAYEPPEFDRNHF
ncbi:MAG: DUF362 domain-containing protein [Thermodesulfobacteriota bacterium]